MKTSSRALGLLVACILTAVLIAYGNATGANAVYDKHHPQIQAVMDVQNRHTHKLMAIPDVVGTAVGLTDSGSPALLVFTRNAPGAGAIPQGIEGIPVVVKVTGEFAAKKIVMSDKSAQRNTNTAIFPQPVPIGVSTGNIGECSAGTISARVKDGAGRFYALSNNHVYALENNAPRGSEVLQPGLYDTGCAFKGNNVIGTLYDFVPISFNSGTNTVDAAIASSSTAQLGKATPAGGYGVPNHITAAAYLGQPVQKYGRTTSLTAGAVNGINATVAVSYGGSGSATFVDQIFVGSSKPFIKAGDSGSLLVTNNSQAYPVGLLFAGNSSGTFAIANRIDNVLSSFGVTVDGK